jgi:hypothetical protein
MPQPMLFANVALPVSATAGQTSTVGEPSVARAGDVALYSGNWYAARSFDGGATWSHVDPYTFFPRTDGGFCCDQTLIFDRGRDLFIWLLQYSKDTARGRNTLRIAACPASDVAVDNWHFWDLVPEEVEHSWTNQWFDYNHAALSDNFLYVGSNMFQVSPEKFTQSVVFRVSLDELKARGQLTHDFFTAPDFSLRCTLGATTTMYFGTHVQTNQIRVFAWPEASASVTSVDVDVTRWQGPPYTASQQHAGNWMGRASSRITAAWLSGGVIGFLWTANRQGSARPFPFVRAARIDAASMTRIDEPDIWRSDVAFGWPDACPNSRGDLAVSLFMGGGTLHPGHVVGLRTTADPAWRLKSTKSGTHSPSDGKWGDYINLRPSFPQGLSWVSSGYTLQGGGARTDIQPRFVHFGLPSDAAAVTEGAAPLTS